MLFTWGPRHWGDGLFHWKPVWSHYEVTTEPRVASQRTQVRSPWTASQMCITDAPITLFVRNSYFRVCISAKYWSFKLFKCVWELKKCQPVTASTWYNFFCLFNQLYRFKYMISSLIQENVIKVINVLPGRFHPCVTRRNAASVSSSSSPKEPQSVSRRKVINTCLIFIISTINLQLQQHYT